MLTHRQSASGEPMRRAMTLSRAWILLMFGLITAVATLPARAQATYPGRNGVIAYTSTSHANVHTVRLINPLGGDNHPLLRLVDQDLFDPAFSPNGATVVFGQDESNGGHAPTAPWLALASVPDVAIGTLLDSRAYVVYGSRSRGAVDVRRLGRRGYVLRGPPEEATGSSVSAAGDVNRDGLADVIIGSPAAATHGRSGGSAYVVFGGRSNRSISLVRLGARGVRFIRSPSGSNFGTAVSALTRTTQCARGVMIGAPDASPHGLSGAGEAYAFCTAHLHGVVDVRRRRSGQARLDGTQARGGAGTSVASLDFRHTGSADLVVGAPNAGRGGGGILYVFPGVGGRR